MAQIFVESVFSAEVAQEYVRETVIINIADGHAGAVIEDAVGCPGRLIQFIRKMETGRFR